MEQVQVYTALYNQHNININQIMRIGLCIQIK